MARKPAVVKNGSFFDRLFRMNTWRVLLLLVILIFVSFQVFFVLQTDAPSYDSFYGVRQVEHIKETGTPIIHDDQSYQGRTNVSHLLFYYILAGFSFLIPGLLLFKFGGIVLTVLIVILIYSMSNHLFRKEWIAFMLSTIAAFTPTIFVSQLNNLLPQTFFVLIYLLLIYAFFTISRRSSLIWFIVLTVLATVISPLSLVLIVGFLFYFLLLRLERLSFKKKELELILFSGLFVVWYHLMLYKKLIALFGLQVVSQSVPQELLLSMFRGLNVPLVISFVGVPLIGIGLQGIYHLLFEKRSKKLLLLTAMTFAFGIFTWFGFVPF